MSTKSLRCTFQLLEAASDVKALAFCFLEMSSSIFREVKYIALCKLAQLPGKHDAGLIA